MLASRPLHLAAALRAAPFRDQRLDVARGAVAGDQQQDVLVGRRRDPGHRPDLGVAQGPGLEAGPDLRQLEQRPCHPHLLPGGVEAEAAAPVQPVGGADETVGPPAFQAVELAQDKLFHLQVLAAAGLPVPKTILVQFPVDADFVEREMGFPVVVKTLVGTQGSGVYLCENRDNLVDMLQFVEANNPNAQLILQQFLSESRGRDVRVVSVGGHIVAAMERIAKSGFKSNYSQGGEAKPFEYGHRNELSVAEVMRVLDMDVAGLDFLYDEEVGFRICEVNSSPGFEGLESTCDVDVPAFIYEYLDVKFRISRKAKARLLARLKD